MKRNSFFLLLFAVLTMVVMVGCDKENDKPDGNNSNLPKVLLAGADMDILNPTAAVCWEDGAKKTFASAMDNTTTSVFCDGSDIYYAGRMENKPTIWKNGVAQVLSQTSGCVNDIYVSNGMVYAVGQLNHVATLWRNGTAESLATNYQTLYPYSEPTSEAFAVSIANGKVYVAGCVYVSGTSKAAYLWTNGTYQMLSDGGGCAYDVFVDGTTVYVVGEAPQESSIISNLTVPALWTNGTLRDLTPTNQTPLPGRATCVWVDNHVPYVTFYQEKGSMYQSIIQGYLYENGTTRELSCRRPYAVCKKDGDLYIAGRKEQWVGHDLPVLLKNNEEQTLEGAKTPGCVNAIFVR